MKQLALLPEIDAEAQFKAFHAANPHVYERLRTMALTLRRAGKTRWGIRNLWERLRYDLAIETTEHEPRLNDHYTAFYARLLMLNELELKDFFETRSK